MTPVNVAPPDEWCFKEGHVSLDTTGISTSGCVCVFYNDRLTAGLEIVLINGDVFVLINRLAIGNPLNINKQTKLFAKNTYLSH